MSMELMWESEERLYEWVAQRRRMNADIKEKRSRQTFGLVFGLLAAGIVCTGFFYYRHYEQHYRDEVEKMLAAVAELKVGELVQYRLERIGDANLLFKNAALNSLVRRYFAHSEDLEAQRQLEDWMSKFQQNYQYEQARLVDKRGATRLFLPGETEPMSAVMSAAVAGVFRSRQVTLQDFYRNNRNQRVYLALLIPILDETKEGQPLAVLILRINPATYLYPMPLKRIQPGLLTQIPPRSNIGCGL